MDLGLEQSLIFFIIVGAVLVIPAIIGIISIIRRNKRNDRDAE